MDGDGRRVKDDDLFALTPLRRAVKLETGNDYATTLTTSQVPSRQRNDFRAVEQWHFADNMLVLEWKQGRRLCWGMKSSEVHQVQVKICCKIALLVLLLTSKQSCNKTVPFLLLFFLLLVISCSGPFDLVQKSDLDLGISSVSPIFRCATW